MKTTAYPPPPELPPTPTLPFLKWAGGKRWLASMIGTAGPPEFHDYYEPFLGGGAVFFHLGAQGAFLSDVNPELVNVYVQVARNIDQLIAGLRALRVNRRTYDRIKASQPTCEVQRAIRFIYLNKTAFNGLYRVNKNGIFNVPYAGYKGRSIFDEDALRSAARLLATCTISTVDFEESLAQAASNDFVYCDPPYTVKHDNNGFIRYNEGLFSWGDQCRLAIAAKAAVQRGAYVIVSNACHQSVRQLYKGFRIKTVTRASCMAGVSNRRGKVSEYLFIGDPGTR